MVLRAKPTPPPAPPPPAPVVVPPPPALTHDDVLAMLAKRDAEWAAKLADMQQALLSALAAQQPQQPPPIERPRNGARITFETDHRGVITAANIIPKE